MLEQGYVGFLLCHWISLYKIEVFRKWGGKEISIWGMQWRTEIRKKKKVKNKGQGEFVLGGVLSEEGSWSLLAKPHGARGLVVEADAFSPELYYDRGNHHEFVSLVKDLARPGEISQSQAFDFEFTHVEKPYESYTGQNVKLR